MTMPKTCGALRPSTGARPCTRHMLSVAVRPVPPWRPSDGGDYMARALARTIAATAHLSFFDSRGKLGGPRLKVKASSDEVSMRLVAESAKSKSATGGAQHRA